MKNKLLLLLVVILSIILVVQPKNKKENVLKTKKENIIKIKNESNNGVENKEMEDYIVGVVAAEMPATFSFEALKAQAVAARSYAYYKMKASNKEYDILSDISNQAYINKEQMREKWNELYDEYLKKIEAAVSATKDEVMKYNNDVIEAFYFSMSNGKTEDSKEVFGESLPYIEEVESVWDNESVDKFIVNTQLSTKEFCQKLNIECNNIVINNQVLDETNRTKTIDINSTTFKGTEIRKKLNLRSTDFKIILENENITITTKGYGHGVGMSQYGANGMAKEGYDYKDILKHYYKDIIIEKI